MVEKMNLKAHEKELIDLLSLEDALNDIQLIYDIGEKAVGTLEETQAANIIKDKFLKIGLKNVRLEPYSCLCLTYKLGELEILSPVRKKVPCKYGYTKVATSKDGITAEIIDAGYGSLQDFEKLRACGVSVEGKILLIERNDRLMLWSDVPVLQAIEFGAAAVVFASVLYEHTALRTDPVPSASIPVLFIPYIDAQEIRNLLRQGKVEANLKNIVEVDENGTSYNVIGEIPGSKFPDQSITLSAHHDSFFGAANDNATAVALILDIARILVKHYKPSRTIRFLSFGGEEAGIDELFYWLAGSYAYVNQHKKELEKTIANVNFDAFAYGLKGVIRVSPELIPIAKKVIDDLNLGLHYDVISRPSAGNDAWSFFTCGVPIFAFGSGDNRPFEKIYHTDYDMPELINQDLMKYGMQLGLLLTLKLDSSELLPYDFTTTSEILLKDLTARQNMVENFFDIRKTLKETATFKALAEEFNLRKTSTSVHNLSESVISSINDSLRNICSMLNINIINTTMDELWPFHENWMIPYYLDMLATVKRTISTMREGNVALALKHLKSFTTMSWGLNVSPTVYEKILTMAKTSRHPAFIINLAPELYSIQEKLKNKNQNIAEETSSVEKKYAILTNHINERFMEIENSLSNSASQLLKIICKLSPT